MTHKRDLCKAIDTSLRPVGFTKKGSSWVLDGRDTIVEVYTDKKTYENVYRICVAIWIRELRNPDDPYPKPPHFDLSLGGILTEDRDAIREACSLDQSDQAALSRLSEILEGRLAPLAQELVTIDGLRKHFLSGQLTGGLVRGEARALLSG